MQKQDWVNRIEQVLESGDTFIHKTCDDSKTTLLLAVDVFRRLNHNVSIHIEPTEYMKACLTVIITPAKGYYEYTLRRDDEPLEIIESIRANKSCNTVSIRGCGTVINSLFTVLDWTLHNGWFVEKTFMSTLTQTVVNHQKQRNTTLNIVIHRGSNISTI